VDHFTGFSRKLAAKEGVKSIHSAFPGSLLIYTAGAVLVEIGNRLFVIPLVLWLFSSVILRGRWQEEIFWVLAASTSLLELRGQDLLSDKKVLGGALTVYLGIQMYILNLLQAYFFREYGFLSSILLRIGDYLIWHVIGGALSQKATSERQPV